MRDTRGLLILLGAVVLIAAGVWFWTRPSTDRAVSEPVDDGPIRFEQTEVPVRSADLKVGDAEARGAIYPEFSSWLITMDCAEQEGCVGEFAVEVRFRGGGDSHRVVLVNRCDAPDGGELRFEGTQDSSIPVERVDRLTLVVRERGAPDGPSDIVEL